MIYETQDKVKKTDKVMKYSKTHKFVTGQTFEVQKILKGMGGVFDTLLIESGRDYRTKEPLYNSLIKSCWIINEKAEEANEVLINAA